MEKQHLAHAMYDTSAMAPAMSTKPANNEKPPSDEYGCVLRISLSTKVKLLSILACTFILLFILMFFILLGGVHIGVSIRDPTIAAFQIQELASNGTTTGNAVPTGNGDGNAKYMLNTDMVFSVDVRNPTTAWGHYYYEGVRWHVTYENIMIAMGILPSFSQGPSSETVHRLRLQGVNTMVPASLAFDLQSNKSALNIRATTSFYVHLTGSVIKYGYRVVCNLTFPPPAEGFTRLQSTTACLVADQDRGKY
ncbi:hypothetical protein KP509_10G002700 [Ceratopteris richardii]|nr:hypothetical protein KP509_10G002700 [Ceratopteris richardii]